MKKFGMILAVALVGVLAVSSSSQAVMGVGVDWFGTSSGDALMVLPIKMASGMIIEPMAGFAKINEHASESGYGETYITVGLRVEKAQKQEGASALWGACAAVDLSSVDLPSGVEAKSSFTDFMFGVYLGGSVPIADGLDLTGRWGPKVEAIGKRSDNGDGATNFGSMASLTFRWWVFGN